MELITQKTSSLIKQSLLHSASIFTNNLQSSERFLNASNFFSLRFQLFSHHSSVCVMREFFKIFIFLNEISYQTYIF